MRKVPALLIMTALLIGCTQRVIEYRADPESGVSVSKLSQDEYWKRQVDDHIKAEVAGQRTAWVRVKTLRRPERIASFSQCVRGSDCEIPGSARDDCANKSAT